MRKQFVWGAVLVAFVLFIFAVTLRSASDKPMMHREMQMNKAASTGSMAVYASDSNGAPAASAPAALDSGFTPAASSATSTSQGAEQTAKLTLASMSDSEQDRYLIKNAVVTIEAGDVRKAAEQAKDAARAASGYVSNSHETLDNLGLRNVTLEVRVPSSEFDSSMGHIESVGKVLDDQVTSEDVTEQYVDTSAQLRNLKETEARLLGHLNQAGKLSDILLVESEVNRVRSSIDELEGKMRFMSHRISFSTISLTFKEPAHAEPIAPIESFSLGQVTTQAMRSVSGFMQSVMSLGVWVMIWSVFWAPLLVGGRYAYGRYMRKAGQIMR